MGFLKKHYEKILLGIVLVGLAVAVGFLPFIISAERQKLEELTQSLTNPRVKELTNLDLSTPETALARASTNATVVDFSSPHRLFNPVPWKRAADLHLIKVGAENIGPRAVTITKLAELNLILTLDSVKQAPDGSPRYVIVADNEATGKKKSYYAPLNVKEDLFTLRQVEGATNEPTKIVLEMTDTGEKAIMTNSAAADQPGKLSCKRVEAYKADLKYAPEVKSWTAKRVGQSIALNGEDYKIVAITKSEVVLSAPNQKKWTISATITTP
jgi:hypothetical protein